MYSGTIKITTHWLLQKITSKKEVHDKDKRGQRLKKLNQTSTVKDIRQYQNYIIWKYLNEQNIKPSS